MILHPAVVVHGLDDARAALGIARPVTLLSARGAALYAGCLWWRALVEQAAAAFPDAVLNNVLDCADAPGRAMAALRIGQKILILDPASPPFPAVAAAARTLGATVLPARPPALDLAHRGAVRRLSDWLRGDSAGPLV